MKVKHFYIIILLSILSWSQELKAQNVKSIENIRKISRGMKLIQQFYDSLCYQTHFCGNIFELQFNNTDSSISKLTRFKILAIHYREDLSKESSHYYYDLRHGKIFLVSDTYKDLVKYGFKKLVDTCVFDVFLVNHGDDIREADFEIEYDSSREYPFKIQATDGSRTRFLPQYFK